ncbi:MAG: phenylalanine--tRNA ligase subunit alpha [Candidatus Micrarchaeota archaeon]|nr:phenylalanine--tRNA ligase subunit alpha [Candidatus Micrarchaeota archaeon]
MADIKGIIYSLHPLERKVLPHIGSDFKAILAKAGVSEAEALTAISMLSERGLAQCERGERKYYILTPRGEQYLKIGLPEHRLLAELAHGEKRMSELSLPREEVAPTLGVLKKRMLITVEKAGNDVIIRVLRRQAQGAGGQAKQGRPAGSLPPENPLTKYSGGLEASKLPPELRDEVEELVQRGLVKEYMQKTVSVRLTQLGRQAADALTAQFSGLDLAEEVTEEMLKSGLWRGKEFRHYDVALKTQGTVAGRRHPMVEANNILRDIFIEMGFQEMEGPVVEAAFWNMDVMWIPQDHPARDEQDTFYVEGRARLDTKLIAKFKEMHERGLKRTHTTKGEWSEEVASRMLLRTHSTATTFRTLALLAERARMEGREIANGKYFYVAHNFRNEKVDATHLAEFFQAEGFIIGDSLSLADLMGFVREYYARLGITKIRFKPTYNPYTEPSMEAHYYDPKLGKWYALINSGIFRPETLKPLGIEKSVIAWGMGASRIAMLLTGAQSMRDITGATCDLEWLRTRPVLSRNIVR